jgi:hypothetical protein
MNKQHQTIYVKSPQREAAGNKAEGEPSIASEGLIEQPAAAFSQPFPSILESAEQARRQERNGS